MKQTIWGIIILLVAFGGWLIYTDQGTVSEDVEEEVVGEEATEEEIALYPEGDWKEAKASLGASAIFVDGGDPLSAEGEEWHLTISDLSDQGLKDLDFREHYADLLSSEGWTERIELDGMKYMPIMADGPYSSVWGYLKLEGDAIKVIALAQETSGEQISGPDEPVLYSEPYEVSLKVFVGEPVGL